MSAPLVKPVLPPYAIAPRPGSTSWWTGDHTQLAYHHPGDPLPHFVSRRAVLSAEQCQLLIDCFERCRESCSARDTDEYWAGRFIWQNFLPDSETAALRLMQQLRSLSLILLYQAFRPERPVYSDTAQLVRWHEGLELTPHVDNMEPDGRPNNTCHRSFASICYLNDDYEGGETYFPGHGVRIKPTPGALIVFGAGLEYVHGVSRITRGMRYTYAGWFTHESALEDTNAPRIF